LMTAGLPPVDLMIRTSGEQRISNFLLWQLAYAELVFTDVSWPDFKEADLMEAVKTFENRNRRFGGL
jgi:undecaprenyl diphosphate synthase